MVYLSVINFQSATIRNSMPTQLKQSWSIICFAALVSTVLLTTFLRLKFGTINQDEGYYLSLVYRMSLGDIGRLHTIADLFALLIFPITSLIVGVSSELESFVLYSRYCYWGFTLLIGLIIFFSLKKYIDPKIAFIVSLFYPSYLHYYPVLFYTNLGVGFFTISLFLSLWALAPPLKSKLIVLIGVSFGFSIISHVGGPPFAFVAYGAALVLRMGYRNKIIIYLISGIMLSALIFPLFSGITFSVLKESIEHSLVLSEKTGIPISSNKFLMLFRWLYDCSPFNGFNIFGCLGFFYLHKKNKKWAGLFLTFLFIPIVYFITVRGMGNPTSVFGFKAMDGGAAGIIRYLSFCGFLFYLLIEKTAIIKNLFYLIWLPSLVMAMSLSFTSNTLAGNLGIGLMPAFIVSSVFLVFFIKEMLPNQPFLSYVPLVLMLGGLLFLQFAGVDKNNLEKVVRGPHSGIYLTQNMKELSETLSQALKTNHFTSKGRIYFQDSPLMGYSYLYSQQKPGVPTTWGCFLGEDLCKKLQEPFNDEIMTVVSFNNTLLDKNLFKDFEKISEFKGIQVFQKKNHKNL